MKFTRLPIRTGPSGNQFFIPVYFFKGKNPKAKKAYFQSSIHGAEVQGNALIFSLIEIFKENPPLGDVTLVPLANPIGMDRKTGEYTDGRFDPVTGENWNRAYLSYDLKKFKGVLEVAEVKFQMKKQIEKRLRLNLRFAEKLALTLQSMAVQADLVLDLHNANVSVDYLYANEACLDDALYLGFQYIISIPPLFSGALDEAISAPWSKLKEEFGVKHELAPQSYTLELGAQEQLSMKKAELQAKGVIEFLKRHGVVKGKTKRPNDAFVCELKNYVTVYAPSGGLYEYRAKLGEILRKGGELAAQLNFKETGGVLSSIKVQEEFIPILHYSSASVSEGDELFKGFTKWRVLRP